MEYKELISVGVLVYNLEKYLPKCLDSIVASTYQNLEIIIVDDESTDGSLEICRRYAKKDERIRIVTKRNAGIADSMNVVVRESTGAYVGFVDGDDSIYPTMFEDLYITAKTCGCELSACDYVRVQESTGVILETSGLAGKNKKPEPLIWSREKAFEVLVRGEAYKSYAWNKLYKRELFKDIVFPTGKDYEDQFTIYKLILAANQVAYLPKVEYQYLWRTNSVSNEVFSRRYLDYVEAWKTIYDFCRANYPAYEDIAASQYVAACIYTLGRMKRAGFREIKLEKSLKYAVCKNKKQFLRSDLKVATQKRKLYALFCRP